MPAKKPKPKRKKGSPTPANPKLYSRVKSEAKRKFKVYPSAYANGWAVQYCKGKFRKKKGKKK